MYIYINYDIFSLFLSKQKTMFPWFSNKSGARYLVLKNLSPVFSIKRVYTIIITNLFIFATLLCKTPYTKIVSALIKI